jgi:hypothetical protein
VVVEFAQRFYTHGNNYLKKCRRLFLSFFLLRFKNLPNYLTSGLTNAQRYVRKEFKNREEWYLNLKKMQPMQRQKFIVNKHGVNQ